MDDLLWLDMKAAADGAIYEHMGYAAILRVVADRLPPSPAKVMLLFQADIAEQGAGR